MTKQFALMGAAGYIAPRHMQAISETGNQLVAALDPHDAVGILDSYHHDIAFFTEFERFDRYLDKRRREGRPVDYVCVCSPNYLHDAHIRCALRNGAHVICEKPVVLNPWNVDNLVDVQDESRGQVNVILQLRLHPAVRALRERVLASKERFRIELSYVTGRGRWYDYSWKGDLEKSGGVATNIGVHFFDMLLWLFGPVCESVVTRRESRAMSGQAVLERADVNWHLSVDKADIPDGVKDTTYRRLSINGDIFDFSQGFETLHTQSYEDILKGKGFTLHDARPSIAFVAGLRECPLGTEIL